jgi:hypothetical protein
MCCVLRGSGTDPLWYGGEPAEASGDVVHYRGVARAAVVKAKTPGAAGDALRDSEKPTTLLLYLVTTFVRPQSRAGTRVRARKPARSLRGAAYRCRRTTWWSTRSAAQVPWARPACARGVPTSIGGDQDANAVAATQQRLERVAEGLRGGQYAPEATQRDVRQLYVAGDTVHASAAVRTARAGIHVRA